MSTDADSRSSEIVQLVADLLEQVSGTSVVECELRTGQHRVFLRRRPLTPAPLHEPPPSDPDAVPAHWRPIISPLTGIYYGAETPQSPPFVTVGTSVSVGQTIGLIEAMKTFNRVECELAGILRAIVVPNGSEVQAGQTLMYLESAGEV